MKKILLSIGTIGVLSTLMYLGYTGAFFSDTETSTGNILQAGALDLKIDNTCYYNGNACVELFDNQNNSLGSFWNGDKELGECSCNWTSDDLSEEHVFFHFDDLKPGDWEEDTISIEVDNPSWLCLDIDKTNDDDNTCTEPESEAEPACLPGQDGELDNELRFVFWRDDGDNVFEDREANSIITEGLASEVLGDKRWALADSTHGPAIPGGVTVYIGKFFCYGNITQSPVVDGINNSPTVASGFKCDGKSVDNVSQTDVLEGDIVFYAEQARHNEGFLCNPEGTLPPDIILP